MNRRSEQQGRGAPEWGPAPLLTLIVGCALAVLAGLVLAVVAALTEEKSVTPIGDQRHPTVGPKVRALITLAVWSGWFEGSYGDVWQGTFNGTPLVGRRVGPELAQRELEGVAHGTYVALRGGEEVTAL